MKYLRRKVAFLRLPLQRNHEKRTRFSKQPLMSVYRPVPVDFKVLCELDLTKEYLYE